MNGTGLRPDWSVTVTAHLLTLKRNGWSFDAAWEAAMREHPPRARDMGGYRPTLIPEPGEAESHVEFLHRACGDAWHGRRPALRFFTPSMLNGEADVAGVAGKGRSRLGMAA